MSLGLRDLTHSVAPWAGAEKGWELGWERRLVPGIKQGRPLAMFFIGIDLRLSHNHFVVN